MRKICIDLDKISKAYIRMNLALAGGLVDADAEQGEIIVMDVHDATVVGHASLKIHCGEGGFVFRSGIVKETNNISLTLSDFKEYLDVKDFCSLPLRVIMPILSYLVILEYGASPTDKVTWIKDSKEVNTSVEDLFLQGHSQVLAESAEMFMPNGINTLNAICNRLHFLAPESSPNLEQLQRERLYSFQMLDWINKLSIGEGLSTVFKQETDDSTMPRKSIKMLQELMLRSGDSTMSKVKGDAKAPICGYTCVTKPDCHHFRDITFCGYFPADKPQYGTLVWLHKKEESEELFYQERKELGIHAAKACKTVVDYIMSLC